MHLIRATLPGPLYSGVGGRELGQPVGDLDTHQHIGAGFAGSHRRVCALER